MPKPLGSGLRRVSDEVAHSKSGSECYFSVRCREYALTSCGRCVGSLDNSEEAIDIARPALDVSGIQLIVRKLVVESEEQARQYKFVTSPPVRINGRDSAFETVER